MPELPEVETIVRRLRPLLVGRTFTTVSVKWERTVQTPLDAFHETLPGLRILSVGRRGKWVWMALSNGTSLLVHLRMTGDLQVVSEYAATHPHDRVIMGLDSDQQLKFKDQRKFGRIHLLEKPETVLAALGPEPLDTNFTEEDFVRQLDGRKRMIKPLLLDQTFVVGLGNIYADETLFLAGVRPDRTANTLSMSEKQTLYRSIRAVLAAAIEGMGSTLADRAYLGGEYQERLNVYGRESKCCYKCGTMIERTKLAQRSSHFCPLCQR